MRRDCDGTFSPTKRSWFYKRMCLFIFQTFLNECTNHKSSLKTLKSVTILPLPLEFAAKLDESVTKRPLFVLNDRRRRITLVHIVVRWTSVTAFTCQLSLEGATGGWWDLIGCLCLHPSLCVSTLKLSFFILLQLFGPHFLKIHQHPYFIIIIIKSSRDDLVVHVLV